MKHHKKKQNIEEPEEMLEKLEELNNEDKNKPTQDETFEE
jgi:hypothetical protein